MSYNIPAKPTKYNGRLYRSRLEARYAAFFDLIGWEFEYEPFDLVGWSPDFLLKKNEVLVEVKPLSQWNSDFLNKVYRHCRIMHEDVYFDEEVMIIGKHVVYKGNTFLEDVKIDLPLLTSFEYWEEAANKVMFLNPLGK